MVVYVGPSGLGLTSVQWCFGEHDGVSWGLEVLTFLLSVSRGSERLSRRAVSGSMGLYRHQQQHERGDRTSMVV